MKSMLAPLLLLCAAGCVTLGPDPLRQPAPPLRDMQAPLGVQAPPEDEEARRALPLGCFTGLQVEEAAASLEALAGASEGLEVTGVAENSPAHLAGIRPGDLLRAARLPGEGAERPLAYASQWRSVELDARPGSPVTLELDRAGRLARVELIPVPRVAAPSRGEVERYFEEQRVGVGVRTATEVEARAAGLGPGGGAVVVALARSSPWRKAGLLYGDLIVHAGGREIAHPQALLAVLREAPPGKPLPLVLHRDGRRLELEAPLTERRGTLYRVNIPVLFHYEKDRDESGWSVLLGLLGSTRTAARWRFRLLWVITFSGGDSDRLREVST